MFNKRKTNPLKNLKVLKKNIVPQAVQNIKQSITITDFNSIKNDNDNRTAVFIHFLGTTGCRISEATEIKNEDIKEYTDTSCVILLHGKGDKDREVYISLNLLNKIKRVYNQQDVYLFTTKNGNKINRTCMYRNIDTYCKYAISKKVNPHMLRHYYATTQIINNGRSVKAVSKYLGHASTSVTQDMYVDCILSNEEAII